MQRLGELLCEECWDEATKGLVRRSRASAAGLAALAHPSAALCSSYQAVFIVPDDIQMLSHAKATSIPNLKIWIIPALSSRLDSSVMQRRAFLKGTGAVIVVVIAGGVWRAYEDGVFSSGKGAAYEPWRDWRTNAPDELALVRAAILAANPHNTQPWLFRVSESRIELYADMKRNTGALDPYLREMHIGLGCALENLTLAAPPNGYSPTVTMLPGSLALSSSDEPQLVASVELAAAKQEESELYDAIPRRHTNRNPYSDKPLSQDLVESITWIGAQEPDLKTFIFTEQSERQRIAAMMLSANATIYSDPQVQRGSDDRWTQLNWHDVQKFRDGLTTDTFGQSSFTTAMMKMMPSSLVEWAWRFKFWHTDYSEVLKATPLFGIIAVRDRYDRVQSLWAGRTWQRTHLWATTRGLAGRPVNEIVELVDHERLRNQPPKAEGFLSDLLGESGWQPTFMFRLGYPIRSAPASPRRPLRDVLVGKSLT